MNRYYLGKCDGYSNGRKNCEAYITWKLEDGNFSMQAEIWNSRKTDIIQGGQCVDSVVAFFPQDKKAKRMLEIWKRWHLNDLHAGCEHQRAAKWEDVRIPRAELPSSHANSDENGLMASWVYKTEHPKGLLCEPCPTCGYKYGSAWLKEELPSEVIKEIESWSKQEAII